MSERRVYVAFLLGINIGKHKRVPMAELRQMCEEMGFGNVRTLLASGNVVFDSTKKSVDALARQLELRLEQTFGFEVGVIVRTIADLKMFVQSDPFKKIKVTKNTRLYVTFFTESPAEKIKTPAQLKDKRGAALQILALDNQAVFSVVEIGDAGTTDAMAILTKLLGKKITTRNWNTILKLVG